MTRCKWCNLKNQKYIEYHDKEWCVPNFDDKYLYEMLILESFQAGLSWECILNKREYLKLENILLILIKRVMRGFAIKSKTKTRPSFKYGISANIELIKPIKLKIPMNDTTIIFATTENGAKLLK